MTQFAYYGITTPQDEAEAESMEQAHYKNLDAMTLFRKVTYLGNNDQTKRQIERHCIEQGYFPQIDYSEGLGWVFHSLYDGIVLYRKGIAARFSKARALKAEKGIEKAIANYLKSQGHEVWCQVRCKAGLIDIVTKTTVFEVKPILTRASMFEAIGQVLIYRQVLNPTLQAAIVGNSTGEAITLVRQANDLGVSVWFWDTSEVFLESHDAAQLRILNAELVASAPKESNGISPGR